MSSPSAGSSPSGVMMEKNLKEARHAIYWLTPDGDLLDTACSYAERFRSKPDPRIQDTVTFYNITDENVRSILDNAPGRVTFFGEEMKGFLFIRVLIKHQEAVRLGVEAMFEKQVNDKNLRSDFKPMGKNFLYERVHDGCAKMFKQADYALLPITRTFPSLVVDCGDEECEERLRKDRQFSFNEFGPEDAEEKKDGDTEENDASARVVITATISLKEKRIQLKMWKKGQVTPSQTISFQPKFPEKDLQELTGMSDWSDMWTIEGAPMVVPFEDVVARPKGSHEVDFILTEDMIGDWAYECMKDSKKQEQELTV